MYLRQAKTSGKSSRLFLRLFALQLTLFLHSPCLTHHGDGIFIIHVFK
ncbi:hypothetical protein QY97_01064 [Bacillus thermotolerans]|nr:hypothetical protein QY97_01064 [Bacillus thermotolerans]